MLSLLSKWSLFLATSHLVAAEDVPIMAKEYSAVMILKMPYIGLEMPLRVVTSSTAQKIEYFDGLEVDVTTARGTYKYAFNNSRRVCMFQPATNGPMALGSSAWQAEPFLPDLSQYSFSGSELIGGRMCQKYELGARHGTKGTMDDHISFYWDTVLGKPVRWHMHSREVTFGSHTDEYVMDFLSFQSGSPSQEDMLLPDLCKQPARVDVAIQVRNFLLAARAMRAPPNGDVVPLAFDAFVRKFGKSYSPEEHALRRGIFEDNARLVAGLNRQHAGKTSFKANHFLDMTGEEVLRFRGGKAKAAPRSQRRTAEQQRFVRVHEHPRLKVLPKAFDWRTAQPGAVGPVKDQGMCGSCWAYGAMGPVESILAVQTGHLVTLPEQFIVDCTWTNNTGSSGSNSGCDGGDSDIGLLEVVRKYGGVIPSAAAYGSYLSVNGYCKDTRLMEVGARVTGWVDVKSRDELGLLHALVNNGPVNVNIMVPPEMLFYDSGVLKVDSCQHNSTLIDHSVVLVGFGTDEHGTNYYTIRNSWSTYWGDEGYLKIARGELDCSVTDEAGYPQLASAEAAVVVV